MNKNISWIIGIIFFIFICYIGAKENEYRYTKYNTSSPVKEMYHRILVTTLDSILDARFNCGCYEEYTDSNNVTVTYD